MQANLERGVHPGLRKDAPDDGGQLAQTQPLSYDVLKIMIIIINKMKYYILQTINVNNQLKLLRM